jgi:hypothetical protein
MLVMEPGNEIAVAFLISVGALAGKAQALRAVRRLQRFSQSGNGIVRVCLAVGKSIIWESFLCASLESRRILWVSRARGS